MEASFVVRRARAGFQRDRLHGASYLPSYLSSTLHFDEAHGLFLVLLVMVLMMPMTLFAGHLSDTVGRKPVMLFGCIGLFALAIPALLLIRTGSTLPVFGGL